MHDSVMKWVNHTVQKMGLHKGNPLVLEVGSRNVNGSVRSCFQTDRYIGIDRMNGPGVDLVMDAVELNVHPEYWERDIVVSTEMLEHCLRPWEAIAAMSRALRSNGVMILTWRGYEVGPVLGPHDESGDFWRGSKAGTSAMLNDNLIAILELADDPEVAGVFAVGRKL